MCKHEIIFTLNSTEKLIVSDNHPDDVCCCCTEDKVYFVTEDKRYYLGGIASIADLSNFGKKLEYAIKNELKLDQSIKADIGYSWNKEAHYSYGDLGQVPGFVYENIQEYVVWIGERHTILSTSVVNKLGTWLYNDNKGVIVFEIAPIYPWHLYDPESESYPEDFISYDEFIENYKPILKREIPLSVAQRWYEQAKCGAQSLRDMVEQNFNEKG